LRRNQVVVIFFLFHSSIRNSNYSAIWTIFNRTHTVHYYFLWKVKLFRLFVVVCVCFTHDTMSSSNVACFSVGRWLLNKNKTTTNQLIGRG
jgi:hypothetical protein